MVKQMPRVETKYEDDYDPPDANWISITTISSPCEEELDTTEENHLRPRPIFGGPWKKGAAPNDNA